MEAFRPCPQGWCAAVSEPELMVFSQLIDEVLNLLDAPVIEPAWFGAIDTETNPSREKPESPSLARLLPQMSRDIDEAGRLRALTEDDLRTDKSRRLEEIAEEISHPSGPEGSVLVPVGKEIMWLAGLNDLRLALSARLKVVDAASADRVYQAAASMRSEDDSDIALMQQQLDDPDSPDPYISAVYTAIAWWQESLLASMEHSAPAQ